MWLTCFGYALFCGMADLWPCVRQAGVLWFLVTPALVVVAPMLGKVWRHRFVTAGSVFMQTSSLLMMCRLFLTSSTEYYKLSSMANMGTMLGTMSTT